MDPTSVAPMRSAALDAHLAVIDRQRTEALAALAPLSPEELWTRPLPEQWSIGEWLDHLYRTLRVQRIACQLYVPIATPFARRFRHRPYETRVHDLFADPRTTVPGPSLPCFTARRRRSGGRPSPLSEVVTDLRRETAALRRVVDVEEGIAGHIVYRDLRFGRLNLIQSIQVVGFHERNDLGHVADVGRRLGFWT